MGFGPVSVSPGLVTHMEVCSLNQSVLCTVFLNYRVGPVIVAVFKT